MTRKRDAGEELLARAKANGYRRGVHKEKDESQAYRQNQERSGSSAKPIHAVRKGLFALPPVSFGADAEPQMES
jgi:TPP-dependent pyruvate/acetoin dehydrogenase alpha subunit